MIKMWESIIQDVDLKRKLGRNVTLDKPEKVLKKFFKDDIYEEE